MNRLHQDHATHQVARSAVRRAGTATLAGVMLLATVGTGATGIANASSAAVVCPAIGDGCAAPLSSVRHTTVPVVQRSQDSGAPVIAAEARIISRYLQIPGVPRLIPQGIALRVTGSNFVPGKKVTISVFDTSTSIMLARGSTYTQDALLTVPCPGVAAVGCYIRNYRAGTFNLTMRVYNPPAISRLQVVYRSAKLVGTHNVTMRPTTTATTMRAARAEYSCLDGRTSCRGFGSGALPALPRAKGHAKPHAQLSFHHPLQWWHEPDSGNTALTRPSAATGPTRASRGWWHEPDSGEVPLASAHALNKVHPVTGRPKALVWWHEPDAGDFPRR